LSAPLATSAADCCAPCESPLTVAVPGPAGAAGAAGAAGTNGVSAFTVSTAGFVMPAGAATVNVAVANSSWASVGQVVYVKNAGYFTVDAIPDATHLTLKNLAYAGNAAPAAIIGTAQTVSPGGLKGTDGVAVGVTLNSISPTTTRGDLIADNGANAPLASSVRLAAGTDGQQLTALAAQPTGLIYRTITPNAATDNIIPRFDASGATTPTPLQSSGIQITDTTAIQTTAGNARGTSAVDLQPVRGAVTQVASGNNSTIAGGQSNTASGAESAVGGGSANVASNDDTVVSGGVSNTASAANAAIGGGSGNVASGISSVVAGGQNHIASGLTSTIGGGDANTATNTFATVAGGDLNNATGTGASIGGGAGNQGNGSYSTIPGGHQGKAINYGQYARANGKFATVGDAQLSELIWRVSTTDATVGVEAFLDGSSASERASIAVGKSWAFQILAVGRSSAGVDVAWKAEGLIHNNGGTTAIVGGAIVPVVIADGSGGTWGVAAGLQVAADNGNDSLKISVTGAAATLIRWVISARITEVSYP